jgi:hypothetical protein
MRLIDESRARIRFVRKWCKCVLNFLGVRLGRGKGVLVRALLPSPCLQNVGVPKRTLFRDSISRPVLSSVNASADPSRGPPHDSEPVRLATPSLCDSFIHYACRLPGAFANLK